MKCYRLLGVMLALFGALAVATDTEGGDFEEQTCQTSDGEDGICLPIVQCPLSVQSGTSCELGPVDGVCCLPLGVGDGQDVGNFLLQASSKRQTSLRLENSDFEPAVERASQKFNERIEMERNLVRNNIVARKGSPAHLRNAYSNVTKSLRERSQLAGIAIAAAQDLAESHGLSGNQASQVLQSIDLRQTTLVESCPAVQSCPGDTRYRTIDGSCNNPAYSIWGQASIPFTRVLPPRYDDGVGSPRSTSLSGRPLKSAREISQALTITSDALEFKELTLMVMQWGQFLDHDITLTPISHGEDDSVIVCCDTNGAPLADSDTHSECFPISVSINDPFYSQHGQTCMSFVRSLPSVTANCVAGHREQFNSLTAYIDASNVYGSSEERANHLRSFTDGLLRTNIVFGKELLPEEPDAEGCDPTQRPYCFLAGDDRVNEQANLAVMHTLWLREHNRIAREFKRLVPSASDEILYQETRRIVGAEMQHITYNEWLPIILGDTYMIRNNLFPRINDYAYTYDRYTNPSINNAFATAAFRFGHTLIASFIQGLTAAGQLTMSDPLSFSQFRPTQLYNQGAVDAMLRSLTTQQSQLFDNLFTEEIKNKLFAQDARFGMDLIALNIQRGRDHGLPSYNEYRRACNLPVARDFRDLRSFFADPSIAYTLRQYYDNVNDIDLFLGGVLEPSTPDSLLGETFQCIVGDQFIRLKYGDKFFYENNGFRSSFTPRQLTEIRRGTSLSRVICDNTDITEIQPFAFLDEKVTIGQYLNRKTDCRRLPAVDLRVFV